MDENLNKIDENPGTAESPEEQQKESMEQNADNIRKFSMDDAGRIKRHDFQVGTNGTIAFARSSRIFIVLGWVSAGFTAFIHPLFAVVGIIFGLLANRQSRGRGNPIIVSNIVLAVMNIIFGLLLMAAS